MQKRFDFLKKGFNVRFLLKKRAVQVIFLHGSFSFFSSFYVVGLGTRPFAIQISGLFQPFASGITPTI